MTELDTAPAGLPAPELDRIRIQGLHVRANHGVHDYERRDGQDFYVDAEVWTDTRRAAASDDVEDTVHYGRLMRALHRSASEEPVDLLETLAERLVAVCFGFAGAQAARITIHKPNAPVELEFGDISVSILRHRAEHEAARRAAGATADGEAGASR